MALRAARPVTSASGLSRRIAAVTIAHSPFPIRREALQAFAYFIIKPAGKKPGLAATMLRAARARRFDCDNANTG
jgi:hypothetical protein